MEIKLLDKIPLTNNYLASVLEKIIGGKRVIDLLLFPPLSYHKLENSNDKLLRDFSESELMQFLEVTIIEHFPSLKISPKKPYKIIAITNKLEEVSLNFFGGNALMWKNAFKKKCKYKIYGRIIKRGNNFTISHPKIISDCLFDNANGFALKAYYTFSPPFTQVRMQFLIKKYLECLKDFKEEWLDDKRFISFKEAIYLLHFPSTNEDIEKSRKRLAFDELLSRNLAFLLARSIAEKEISPSFHTQKKLINNVLEKLPFNLTEDQANALSNIIDIQKKTAQCNILLQGDVGSGKTLVALLAALNVVEAGYQVAIMAPTYILAHQTFNTFSNFIKEFPILFFSGEDKGRVRQKKLYEIASGNASIIIGTHALFSRDVIFKNLGFSIIDEQHKFGIEQRLELSMKAKGIKTLLMTATPIPRTLSMALYGDIEVCYIKSKPSERKEIITKIFSSAKITDIIGAVSRKIETGEKVYWVVPAIEEGEKNISLVSLNERYKVLVKVFGEEQISVVHGRMKEIDIANEMERFQYKKTSIMLATTVIEVGLDIPTATVIIIESAESFGLATLHQLRGRVGRGGLQSYCFLIYRGSGLIPDKLNIIANNNNGFIIAEQDMELRGSGTILRNLQSGFEAFRFANIQYDSELFKEAKLLAKKYLTLYNSNFPYSLKTLLMFFDYLSYLHYFHN